MEQYLSQTEIGNLYGVSARIAGAWLVRGGLRGPDGKPTDHAEQNGYCRSVYMTDRGRSFWVWHSARTLELIEDAIRNGGFPVVDEVDEFDQLALRLGL